MKKQNFVLLAALFCTATAYAENPFQPYVGTYDITSVEECMDKETEVLCDARQLVLSVLDATTACLESIGGTTDEKYCTGPVLERDFSILEATREGAYWTYLHNDNPGEELQKKNLGLSREPDGRVYFYFYDFILGKDGNRNNVTRLYYARKIK